MQTLDRPRVYFNEFDQVEQPLPAGTARFLMEMVAKTPLMEIEGGIEVAFTTHAIRPQLTQHQSDAVFWLSEYERDVLYHGWLEQGYSPAVSLDYPIIPAQFRVQ